MRTIEYCSQQHSGSRRLATSLHAEYLVAAPPANCWRPAAAIHQHRRNGILEGFRIRDYKRCAEHLDAVRYCRYDSFEYSIEDRHACVLPLRRDCTCATDRCTSALDVFARFAVTNALAELARTAAHTPSRHCCTRILAHTPVACALYLQSRSRDLFTRTARERVLPNNDVIARAHR